MSPVTTPLPACPVSLHRVSVVTHSDHTVHPLLASTHWHHSSHTWPGTVCVACDRCNVYVWTMSVLHTFQMYLQTAQSCTEQGNRKQKWCSKSVGKSPWLVRAVWRLRTLKRSAMTLIFYFVSNIENLPEQKHRTVELTVFSKIPAIWKVDHMW